MIETRNKWQKIHYFLLILTVSLTVTLITTGKLWFECDQYPHNSVQFITFEYLYVFLLLFVASFCVGVFIYSARFFPKMYSNELESMKTKN